MENGRGMMDDGIVIKVQRFVLTKHAARLTKSFCLLTLARLRETGRPAKTKVCRKPEGDLNNTFYLYYRLALQISAL